MAEQPHLLSATDALHLLQTGALTVEAYATALLTHIRSNEPTIKAWAHLNPDLVLTQARRLDQLPSSKRGPLFGLPFGVKDIIHTKDMPTSHSSPLFPSPPNTQDAPCLVVLSNHGALPLGKTTTTEFAISTRGPPTTNPHNQAHTPGGSSSGSAAAVAAFHVPLAIGTQTGGSIVRPAAFNGVYGYKPTWGAVSLAGVSSVSPTCDTIGFFARNVADLQLLATAYRIEDLEPVLETPLELKGARIAFCKTPVWEKAEKGTIDAFTEAKELLRARGAEVVDLDLPAAFAEVGEWARTIHAGEGRSSFLGYYLQDKEKLDSVIQGQVENVKGVSRAGLMAAYDGCAALRPVWDGLAGEFDVVITPSVPGEAPEGLGYTGDASFCAMWTVLHAPALNVPGFVGEKGLPVGLTVITTANYFPITTSTSLQLQVAFVLKYKMEESNSNQLRRSCNRASTRERQNVLSENQTHNREHDRHRRRRDLLRAQVGQSIQPIPTSPVYTPVSSTPGRLGDRFEDEPMEEVIPVHSPEHSSRSDTIENQDVPLGTFQHAAESLVEQPLPTTTTDVRNPDIIRLENIFRAANSTLSKEAFGKDQTSQKYMEWGSQLVGLFDYGTTIHRPETVLSIFSSPRIVDTNEQIRDTAISPDIYRLLLKIKHDFGRNLGSKIITEAFGLLEISRYFATEISRRLPILPSSCETCRTRIIEDIKLDFASANAGLNRQDLLIWRETNQQAYTTAMAPINKLYQNSNAIQSFVEEMGTPAALLIWPFSKAQRVTKLALHEQPLVFVSGMIQFIKGTDRFPSIQNLINHMSVWVDGWVTGTIQPHVACGYLHRFRYSGVSPDEDFSPLSMYDVLTSFMHLWDLRGLPSPTVGRLGTQFTFNATSDLKGFSVASDFRAFKPTYRLNERVVASVLATTDLPTNVIYVRASQYGSCHDNRTFMINKAMAIHPEATTILCPVHTGMSDHWVGVVVRLVRRGVKLPTMTLELLDSHVHQASTSLYDENIGMGIILTWLRFRLQDYDRFVIPHLMIQGRVAQETARNSCGVHTLANLIAAGRSSDYPTDSSEEWVDAQRYQYLAQTLRSAADNLILDPKRQFIKTTLINFVDNHTKPGQWEL
ncbi:hypothetical protein VE01_08701 [Pseudogymnoascus verrucosus]|uniref:Amidase domain-containing protein n=1 Tax=Pseudogymnoascus verrucosus TaxID=342668 RepID=A0A1B8GC74_9PEZI|nr:uncharacterized protein VE01_08701 [Pseudogymnoascus verrucosus]OBT93436.1 hypothetical protein VE01_08701 [Pseudogymnoascus verrucosus]